MAPHSSTLAWKIPWTEEPGGLQSMGSLRVGHDWATSLSLFTSCIGEGNSNPLQCSCLENPRDGGAWWAAVYGVTQSRIQLKWLSSSGSSSPCSLEGMMLKLKLQYFGHLMRRVASLEKTLMLGGVGGTTQDEMAGWHHWLDGRESEWTLGVGDGQGGLACCDSWGHKESDTAERLNWTEQNWSFTFSFLKVHYLNAWKYIYSSKFFWFLTVRWA